MRSANSKALTSRRGIQRSELISELSPPYEILRSSVLFAQAFNTFAKAIEKPCRSEGITISQAIALWALLLSAEPLTPTEISRLLPLQTQSVTALLDRLQERKLITRRRSSRDRRSVRITLTAQGEELLRSIVPSIGQVMVDIMENLSSKERQLLDRLARKIRNASTGWLGANPDHLDNTIERLSREEVGRLNTSQRKSQGKGAKASNC
jgi:DNA-binding MarR family transcriptional regulator